MKKFTLCLIACFALIQSTTVAAPTGTPPLINSLLEYKAILNFIGTPHTNPLVPINLLWVSIEKRKK